MRQLRNAITHAVISARDYLISAADLPHLEKAAAAGGGTGAGVLNLDEMERQAIREALERTGGHHQRAAELLGISRRTLTRKLKIYRMECSEESAHFC